MPRKPEWIPAEGRSNDYCLLAKDTSAVVWKNGEGSWVVNVNTLAPTEEAAKALAEKWMKESKP